MLVLLSRTELSIAVVYVVVLTVVLNKAFSWHQLAFLCVLILLCCLWVILLQFCCFGQAKAPSFQWWLCLLWAKKCIW